LENILMGLAGVAYSNRRKNFGLNTQNAPNSKFSSYSLTLSFFSFFVIVKSLFFLKKDKKNI